jgi:hypothetical protein
LGNVENTSLDQILEFANSNLYHLSDYRESGQGNPKERALGMFNINLYFACIIEFIGYRSICIRVTLG